MTTDKLWATMSCTSRAIRVLSIAAPMAFCWSLSISSRSARSASQAMYSLPDLTVNPTKSAATTVAVRKRNDLGTVPAGTHRSAAKAAPTSRTPVARRARGRDSWTATV